jgi:hypothetical protein
MTLVQRGMADRGHWKLVTVGEPLQGDGGVREAAQQYCRFHCQVFLVIGQAPGGIRSTEEGYSIDSFTMAKAALFRQLKL